LQSKKHALYKKMFLEVMHVLIFCIYLVFMHTHNFSHQWLNDKSQFYLFFFTSIF